MKNSPFCPAAGYVRAIRPHSVRACSALLAVFISFSLPVVISRAQPSNYEADGEEVLTRGPVHEAFAAVVSYNPAPGIVVRTRPPELIEELPPEERPEGEDVAWIPGYWGWDDERNDYLWISGTWRILPPGREWMAGYWRETDQGYQWISGYWADSTERETTYLPPPPASLEVGANLDAPSDDYGWSPGCWIWREDRYAWRAGYWAEGRADWVWIPAYYAWTPRGVIFVEGFWDYPVERRGILFAPVYYQSRGYARRGYSYSPRIAINLSLFLDNLFLRPSYHHYYFGDYYGSRYEQDGFYASISFSSSRQGFDPFYSHSRWENRSDRDWDRRFRASYQDRRDHETTRPPRTWAAQVRVNANIAVGGSVRLQLAVPLAQLARSPDHPVRFQSVAQGDRQQLAQRGREVQQSRDQRRTVEAKGVTKGRSASVAVEPVRVAAPRTPIVAKPAGQRGRNPAPPQDQQAPRPNSPAPQPKAENAGRPQNADRRNAPAETRQPEPRRNSPADQRPNESTRKTAPEAQRQAEPDEDRRTRDEQQKIQAVEKSRQQDELQANASARQKRDESQQRANESAARDKQQSEDRRNAADEKARDELQRKNQEAQQQSRLENDQRNRDEQQKSQAADKSRQQDEERTSNSTRKARDETPQKVNDPAPRTPQNEERANVPAPQARAEASRPAPEARGRQQDDPRRPMEESSRPKPGSQDKTTDDEDGDTKKEKSRSK